MNTELIIKDASVQTGKKLMKIIGLLSASELVKLMDQVSLKPNPRSPNVNKITKAITRTIEEYPELLQYKTKGVLAAGNYISKSGKTYTIDFSTPAYGGILDGGHNFFAIVRVMLIDAVRHKYSSQRAEDKRIRRLVDHIRSWQDLTEMWRMYGEHVVSLIKALDSLSTAVKATDKMCRKFSFLLPVEIISPREGTTEREVKGIIHEISVARNNNVQLKEVAIAQHKGSYDLLKQILPAEVNSKVQWKSGENQCPIPPTKVVPLALLPLKKLEEANVLKKLSDSINATSSQDEDAEEASFPPVKLMSMYTSTNGCISIYSQVIDAVANLNESGGHAEIVESIVDSLGVIRDLPAMWDAFEFAFEDLFALAVSGNEKKYSELGCNSKGAAKKETPTRFFTRQIPKGRFVSRAGFVTPLFMNICHAFLKYDISAQKVDWVVSPDRIVDEILSPSKACKAMMKQYLSFIKTMDYDPSKFGKAPLAYNALSNDSSFLEWMAHVKHR